MNQVNVDQVLEFYNYATSLLLDRLSKEIKLSNGTKTWRPLVSYKNLIRYAVCKIVQWIAFQKPSLLLVYKVHTLKIIKSI